MSIKDSILKDRLFGIRIGSNIAASFGGVVARTNMNRIPTHSSTIRRRSLRSVINPISKASNRDRQSVCGASFANSEI